MKAYVPKTSDISTVDKSATVRRRCTGKRLPPKYLLKFALLSALSQKRISAAVALLLAFVTSLLLTASYMSSYSRSRSIAANLKSQRIFSIDISDYTQKLYSSGPEFESPSGSAITPEMTEDLKTKYPDLNFGSCYSFGRTFYDFSDAADLENGFFNTVSFGNYIAVDDFSVFSYELELGSLPVNPDEVVIFDYMADNIIRCALFDSVNERKDLVGYTMTDNATGFKMTVSGILKSNYRDFAGVGDDFSFFFRDNDYYVANYCLTKYRSVFGGREMVERIAASMDKVSFEEMDFSVKYLNEPEREYETISLKGKYMLNCRPGELPEAATVLYGKSDELGYYVRDTVIAALLGMSEKEITSEFLSSFFGKDEAVEIHSDLIYSDSVHADGFTYNYKYHPFSTTVFHWDGDAGPEIIQVNNEGWLWALTGGYAGPVLLLGKDTSGNAGMISNLLPEKHDASWWADDPEKIETGYTVRSQFDNILERLDEYLKVNNSLFGRYAWLVAVFLAIAVFFYTTASVKKNERSIGILRSVGVSRSGVMAVFASSSVGIIIASLPIAVAGSLLILHKANSILSEGFGVKLSVYFFDANAVVRSLLIIACSTAAALLLVWLWLVIRKPVNMIYERRG